MKGIRILFLTVMFTLMTILFSPIPVSAGESRAGFEGSMMLSMDADYQLTTATQVMLVHEVAYLSSMSQFSDHMPLTLVAVDELTAIHNTYNLESTAILASKILIQHQWQDQRFILGFNKKMTIALPAANHSYSYRGQDAYKIPNLQEVGTLSLLRHVLVTRAVI